MLAKNVNDNGCFLDKRGACEFFASKLAPTKSFSSKPPPTFDLGCERDQGLRLWANSTSCTNSLRSPNGSSPRAERASLAVSCKLMVPV